MATFSQEVKTEIAKSVGGVAPCCKTVFLAGLIRTMGSISLRHGGMGFQLAGENLTVLKTAARFAEQLYGVETELLEESVSGLNRVKYRLAVHEGEQILSDCGIVSIDENGLRQICFDIDVYITEQPCCCQTLFKAIFLGAGYVTLPGENKEGYHLEFAFSEPQLAESFEKIVVSHFDTKKILRKKETVLYWKGSEEISDILAFLGAGKSVFRLQNTVAERSIRNRANRQTNCIAANIDKTLDAAERQIAAINVIEKSGQLSTLPKTLIAAAHLRKKYPSESLDELAALSGEKVTKSGLNHRFRRLNEIAATIGKKEASHERND